MNDLRAYLIPETNDISELLYETDVEMRRLGWERICRGGSARNAG